MTTTDLDLVQRYRTGDEIAFEQLLKQYTPLLYVVIRDYYVIGATIEDIWQEARIGFLSAVRTWDPAKASFIHFFKLVVRRQILTFVKSSTRLRQQALRNAVFLEPWMDIAGGDEPEAIVEEIMAIEELICEWRQAGLTDLEMEALMGQMAGFSYDEIATRWGRNPKSVDNAHQRGRRKLCRG